eukprot:2022071-Rhodomonas_salina.2
MKHAGERGEPARARGAGQSVVPDRTGHLLPPEVLYAHRAMSSEVRYAPRAISSEVRYVPSTNESEVRYALRICSPLCA